MAGLYVHIPFCRSKCSYCDFYSMAIGSSQARTALAPGPKSESDDNVARYVHYLLREFDLRKDELLEPISTLYIGGGTPTALPLDSLLFLIRSLTESVRSSNAGFTSYDELTVEANPEDITAESLAKLQSVGVNRISIGIQSFDSEELTTIERRHSAAEARRALTVLRDSGMNYSADLIYGLPGQTIEAWKGQLAELLSFRPPHFSAYLLSYEPGTRLYIRLKQGKISEATEKIAEGMYSALSEMASQHGYNHYEISNFALPGFEAIHNSSYWNLTPYLGLGPSAHSFDGLQRRFNPPSLRKYLHIMDQTILAVDQPTHTIGYGSRLLPYETEDETLENQVNDYIVTSLRTSRGLDLNLVSRRWGRSVASQIFQSATPLLKSGRLILIPSKQTPPESTLSLDIALQSSDKYHLPLFIQDDNLTLIIPEQYWLTADAIMRELIL